MATDCTNFAATQTGQDVNRELGECKVTSDLKHEQGQEDNGESDGDESDLWGSDSENEQEQQESDKDEGEELWEPESDDSIFSDLGSDEEEDARWSSSESILENANKENVGLGRPVRRLVVPRQKVVNETSTQLWGSDTEEEDNYGDGDELWEPGSDGSVSDKASKDEYSYADELSST